MIDINSALRVIYPEAPPLMVASGEGPWIIQDDGDGPYIADWNYQHPMPTDEDINNSWLEIDQE